ncbi:MAG: DUF1826 domain-containing protein [Pseudomonadota bacterium]
MSDDALGVGVADTPGGLSVIRHPACPAVLWRRAPRAGFQRWIDDLDPALLPRARVVLPPGETGAFLADLAVRCGMPPGVERDWLVQDIASMAKRFAELVPAPYQRLRLDVVQTNSCRRFHIDAVTARLVCTYRGTGTQYGMSTDGHDPETIFTVPTGAPILLRGKLWPTDPPSGLRHRSPPIEGTGETRLILVLDPMSEPEEEI